MCHLRHYCAVEASLGSSEMPSKQESSIFSLSLCLDMCGPPKIGKELQIFRVVAGFGLRNVNCFDGID